MCELKICEVCTEEKPLNKFESYYNKNLDKTYYRNKCKKCINSERRARREGKVEAPQRRLTPTKKCISGVKDRFKRQARFSGLEFNYEFISLEWYTLQLHIQNGKCPICERTPEEVGRRLVVDHCHKTGRVRGLLCHNCNTLIGGFKEDINAMLRAIQYLTKDQL